MASVKGFIAVAAKSEGSLELALYITDDVKTWHRAEFNGHRLEEDAYTILESTNYSIQLDVMSTNPSSPMGTLFTSNSNGTYFVKSQENTNRNKIGIVDFEKLVGIEGVAIMNTVDNPSGVLNGDSKVVKTKVTFDDGAVDALECGDQC